MDVDSEEVVQKKEQGLEYGRNLFVRRRIPNLDGPPSDIAYKFSVVTRVPSYLSFGFLKRHQSLFVP